jgi:hypothetical protein
VLIPVSLRSLNLLGHNGFPGPIVPSPVWPQPHVLPLWPYFAPAFAQAWWAWNQRFFAGLVDLAVSGPQQRRESEGDDRTTPVAPAQRADRETKFEVIWGAGYRLDRSVMAGLVEAGWHLREAGVTVLYVSSPLQMGQIEKECSPSIRAQVDSGDRQVVQFLQDQGFQVLDLHRAVETGYFETPVEHLDGPGRRKVSALLLEWLGRCLTSKPKATAAGAARLQGIRPC